ncbi:MAG: hypothetical protein OHK93_004066 [Ramalina farinacea]|uniref:Uncharacterized protein n=1 Tax=Ramalina farinacea TaxID=258253 RepID=A0AA43QG26_9LECA|nr:hypothetical protein [Ramalina farinacea]
MLYDVRRPWRTILLAAAAAISLLILFNWTTRGTLRSQDVRDPKSLEYGSQAAPWSDSPAADIPTPSNGKAIHIVVSHYTEEPFYIARWLSSLRSIPSIATLGTYAIIFTKGPITDVAGLKEVATADAVMHVPNIGREGSTYLNHILANWDDLPPYTLFTQAIIKKAQKEGAADAEDSGTLLPWLTSRLAEKFDNNTGFMSLDRKHDICYCGHCTDIHNRDEFYPLWPQLFAMMEGRVCGAGEPSVLSFNGHFIVSRKRIRERPKELYGYLRDLVDAPEGHWLHEESFPKWFDREKGKSSPQDPKFGHTLERLWHILFKCYDIADVRDCEVKEGEDEGQGGCSCND